MGVLTQTRVRTPDGDGPTNLNESQLIRCKEEFLEKFAGVFFIEELFSRH